YQSDANLYNSYIDSFGTSTSHFILLEALRASTIRAAKLLRIDKEVGLIKEAYYADIIAVPENPLDDVKALQDIGFIMKGGKIIKNQISRVD
ncbi:MAG: amidohydrolase family protein, partial [Nitrososphaerota archaeon]|nr:amidohydrolase family protein [Nitrososphaerota archaeon]